MEGVSGFITLVLILFPLIAGVFLFFRWLIIRNNDDPHRDWHRQNRRRKFRQFGRTRGVLRAARIMPPWLIVAAILGILSLGQSARETIIGKEDGAVISCQSPHIIDGDTLTCDGQRIRLEGIDAPEMPGHCRTGRSCTPGDPYAAKDYLESISRGLVSCHPIKKDVYGRTVARCESGSRDLSCAMIAADHAVRRYSVILCL
ncbi:MAG: thermonuclease family protein [Alphaproteobacteria bacterium]|nr:thermonuclease family protein [Alphaproteobacteria bacterium]